MTTRQHEQEPIDPIPYELAMELHALAKATTVIRNVNPAPVSTTPKNNQGLSTHDSTVEANQRMTVQAPHMQHKPVKGRGKLRNHESLAAKSAKLASKLQFRLLVEALDLPSPLGTVIPRLKLPQLGYPISRR